eukprot:TRINITY_DN28483_c0_g1_i4.p1 TRINITY_DN28483_c0_g1~~TRINITY_DN28483_c0_g1_i4.p1  ORF type:complete len:107 (-),score=10.97 TRINITY_DN28483_c0_g1_i4:10-330(-)
MKGTTLRIHLQADASKRSEPRHSSTHLQFAQLREKYQSQSLSPSSLQERNVQRISRSQSYDPEKGFRSHYSSVIPRSQSNSQFPKSQIGRAVQQECRDRSRMPSSA